MLITPRLILRPLTIGDTDQQFDVLRDPAVSASIGVFKQPFTRDQAEQWCVAAEQFHATGTGLLCNIFEKQTGQSVGYVGTAVSDPSLAKDGIWEVGYWLRKDRWGRGYVPEALDGVTKEATAKFNLKGFFAELAKSNTNSARVVEKSGFSLRDEFLKATPDNPQRPSYRYFRCTI